jgi:hypothetical protein
MTADRTQPENAPTLDLAGPRAPSWRTTLVVFAAGYLGAVGAAGIFPLVINLYAAENPASELSKVTLEGVAWFMALGGIGASIGAAAAIVVFPIVALATLVARLHRWAPLAAALAGAAAGRIASWTTFTTSPDEAQNWLANLATVTGAVGAGLAAWLAHSLLARRRNRRST